ncbi:hypothetical protein [Lentibacillus jeotgali]|uniref:hypothetical protein n=1 Tax=Lentibacillus jeotgali TaxID=558169 RepID=UPI0015854107|nr:hypothetical protein [Lentibacillus jeotgali]
MFLKAQTWAATPQHTRNLRLPKPNTGKSGTLYQSAGLFLSIMNVTINFSYHVFTFLIFILSSFFNGYAVIKVPFIFDIAHFV